PVKIPAGTHGALLAFERELDVFRHHIAPSSDLIHVVPESPDFEVGINGELPFPPFPGYGVGEVREMTPSRPHLRSVRRVVGILEENILAHTFIIRVVPGLDLDAGITNYHHLEAHVAQLTDEAHGVAEMTLVPGEYLVLIHVVDVEDDRVGGDFLFTKRSRYAEYLNIRIIAVSALLIPNAPPGREFDPARKPGVVAKKIGHTGIVHEIIPHGSRVCRKTRELVVRCAKIEEGLVAVVEEDPVHELVVHPDIEWSRAIQWVGVQGETIAVGIPVLITHTAFVERSGFLAKSDKAFPFLKFPIACHLFTIPADAERMIFVDDASIIGNERETNRVLGDTNGECGQCNLQYIAEVTEGQGVFKWVGDVRRRKVVVRDACGVDTYY